ncbi:TetR/AcrR family transcriptional regulator [Mycolicibacterium pyrenivorans]|uniref:TetR/AcrR family transcriptional regulator n=1 Tax=Mycolicibacterium pyrenivorans TaxID=187102 RepID=UPI0021F30B71|nr:TetR/AcrR family transcriptional regulator [Mycolicibacterium pyrenivorans]MCV7149819.1 TetR family transcriptional regulator [Mycolicibacterium pyrenivorans]
MPPAASAGIATTVWFWGSPTILRGSAPLDRPDRNPGTQRRENMLSNEILHNYAINCTLCIVTATGLRVRKKLATKEALGRAAMDLAAKYGLSSVTVDEIAKAANVSARTFFNYFASKEEAVMFIVDRAMRDVITAFAGRDRTEPVLDSLESIMLDFVEASDDFFQVVTVVRLMAEHPTLVPHHVSLQDSATTTMLDEIAERTGHDPRADVYPRLVFHAAQAVSLAAIELHVMGPGDIPSRQVVADSMRTGFQHLRDGLLQPGRAATGGTD